MRFAVATLFLALASALALADPDLPGHTSPSEILERNTLFIPMDRTWQGYQMENGYQPNGIAQNNTFNMRAYAPLS